MKKESNEHMNEKKEKELGEKEWKVDKEDESEKESERERIR